MDRGYCCFIFSKIALDEVVNDLNDEELQKEILVPFLNKLEVALFQNDLVYTFDTELGISYNNQLYNLALELSEKMSDVDKPIILYRGKN